MWHWDWNVLDGFGRWVGGSRRFQNHQSSNHPSTTIISPIIFLSNNIWSIWSAQKYRHISWNICHFENHQSSKHPPVTIISLISFKHILYKISKNSWQIYNRAIRKYFLFWEPLVKGTPHLPKSSRPRIFQFLLWKYICQKYLHTSTYYIEIWWSRTSKHSHTKVIYRII